jgi:hypothetical protein
MAKGKTKMKIQGESLLNTEPATVCSLCGGSLIHEIADLICLDTECPGQYTSGCWQRRYKQLKDSQITLEKWREAFSKAEQDTNHEFNGQTCGMKTIRNEHRCPICFFSIKMKEYLGLIEDNIIKPEPPEGVILKETEIR